jgi:hypothetical protein
MLIANGVAAEVRSAIVTPLSNACSKEGGRKPSSISVAREGRRFRHPIAVAEDHNCFDADKLALCAYGRNPRLAHGRSVRDGRRSQGAAARTLHPSDHWRRDPGPSSDQVP